MAFAVTEHDAAGEAAPPLQKLFPVNVFLPSSPRKEQENKTLCGFCTWSKPGTRRGGREGRHTGGDPAGRGSLLSSLQPTYNLSPSSFHLGKTVQRFRSRITETATSLPHLTCFTKKTECGSMYIKCLFPFWTLRDGNRSALTLPCRQNLTPTEPLNADVSAPSPLTLLSPSLP